MPKEKKSKRTGRKPIRFTGRIILSVILLVLAGLFMVFNASSVEAYSDFDDKYFYLKYQSFYALIGIVLMVVISRFDYRRLKSFVWPLYLINLVLLILVLIPGFGVRLQGSARWLSLGSFVFQPSESMKLISILYLTVWLEKKRDFRRWLIISGLAPFLVLMEPDLGTAMVLMVSAWLVYFLSGARLKEILTTMLIAGGSAAGFIFLSEYRRNRLLAFLDPTRDKLGISYHVYQILLALASGGLTGVGLGQSRQKHNFLPEAPADSIFAVIAEEVGFIGSAFFIFGLVYFVFLLFRLAQHVNDRFGRRLTAAIAAWFGIQIFFNLASTVALIPLTGMTLPFISYGGSSLIISLTAVGIIVNVSRQL